MSAPIDWNDQRAFLAVLEAGSLSAAARSLGLKQPTVRARIEALERAVGTVLFTRSTQGLLPTNAARTLGDHARAMAHASEAFGRAASSPQGEVAGVVRLSVGEFIGVEVLPAMLARLCARHPGLSVELLVSNATANLTEQEADVAVRMLAPSQDTLVRRKVGGLALSLFAHRDYLARRGVPSRLDDLAGHDIIGQHRARTLPQAAEETAPYPAGARLVVRTDSHPAQVAVARAGLGIVMMPRPAGMTDPDLQPVLPGHVVTTLPVFVVTHRDLAGVPRVRAVFDHLAGEFGLYTRG